MKEEVEQKHEGTEVREDERERERDRDMEIQSGSKRETQSRRCKGRHIQYVYRQAVGQTDQADYKLLT